MSTYRIRNPEHLDGCRRFRDRGRELLPGAGLVITDLDVVMRWFGPRYGLDHEGVFALLEIKRGGAPLTGGQRHTFGLLDRLFREAAPDRYLGLHVLHDLGDRWRWEGDPGTLTDADLFAELEGWPRGVA